MRTITNYEEFQKDYLKYYKEPELLDLEVLRDEVERKEDSYELKSYESNVHATIAFLFDEDTVCTDEENDEWETTATYTGNTWK